jgi:hypothetical protein
MSVLGGYRWQMTRTPSSSDSAPATHTQLRLARDLAEDLRRPWEKPTAEPRRLTPARARRGFRNLRPTTPLPSGAPKPSRPGPERPPGTKNKQRAARHDAGKRATTRPSKPHMG